MDPLVIAIPLFLALAAAEAVALHRGHRNHHKLGDLVSGLGCGALDQLVNLTVGAGFIAAYAVLERNVGLLELSPRSIPGWIAAVLLHDLCYYLFHRASHRVNVLWAAHAVHHQSEDYSFAVSLRQGTFATWVSYVFYLPMALVGVPAEVFVVVHGAYQVYQFLVHTRFIPALGPLERVLATPVLHRVHHGRDADFLDKNYGGFFIFWDKLFGTFAPYTREPDYGVVAGIRSWSPLWANLHPYAELVRRARRAPSPRAALAVWLRPPEWVAPWETREPPRPGYGPDVPRAAAGHSLVQLATAVIATLALLWPGALVSALARGTLAAFIVATIVSAAAFYDRKSWAPHFEAVRLGAIAGTLLALALSALF
jgi:sterol desaturase/sphingolipid hydroxylase (fatty acid hydroxylase superfamily)